MENVPKIYDVLTSNPKGHFKTITVRSKEGSSVGLKIHRFAVVGKGDRIKLGTAGSNKISVVAKEPNQADIPVTPCFETNDYIRGHTKMKTRATLAAAVMMAMALGHVRNGR